MSKFTRGKWIVKKEGAGNYESGCLEILPENNPKDICIALCYSTNPNMEEDANLIAAAPELYEACKLALRATTTPITDKDKEEVFTTRIKIEQALSHAIAGAGIKG